MSDLEGLPVLDLVPDGELTIWREGWPPEEATYSGTWTGGDQIRISRELMGYVQRGEALEWTLDGLILTVVGYRLRLVGRDLRGDYLAERIRD